MRKVHLHGHLAEMFRPVYRLDVESAAEAIRALAVQIPKFRREIANGTYRVVRGDLSEENDLPEEALSMFLGRADLHIVPVIGGAKKGGVAKMIMGAVLIAAAFYFAPAAAAAGGATAAGGTAAGAAAATGLGATAFTVLGTSVTFGNIALFGLGMVATGASQLFAPQQKVEDYGGFEPADQRASFIFSAPVNVSIQGHPVPLLYGRMRVGSVVVASGMEAVDVS